jgi:hypothetical protein
VMKDGSVVVSWAIKLDSQKIIIDPHESHLMAMN